MIVAEIGGRNGLIQVYKGCCCRIGAPLYRDLHLGAVLVQRQHQIVNTRRNHLTVCRAVPYIGSFSGLHIRFGNQRGGLLPFRVQYMQTHAAVMGQFTGDRYGLSRAQLRLRHGQGQLNLRFLRYCNGKQQTKRHKQRQQAHPLIHSHSFLCMRIHFHVSKKPDGCQVAARPAVRLLQPANFAGVQSIWKDFPNPPRMLTAKSDCPDKLQAMLPGTERSGYGFIFRR